MRNTILFIFFNVIIFSLLSGCLIGCRTVKEIEKTKTVYDSAAIQENANLKQVLAYEREMMDKEREQWNSTGVVFDTKCDTVYNTRIEFDNGKLKSIEGNVKLLNQSLFEKQTELYDAHRLIDSLLFEVEKKDTKVVKETMTITKTVKRKPAYGWLLWFIPLLLLIGAVVEYRFKIFKRFLSLKNIIMKKLFLFAITALLFLSGCADFHDEPGNSVWSEGLWVLPWATAIGSVLSFIQFGKAYIAFQEYKGKKKLSYGWLIFAGALAIATVVIIYSVVSNR